MNINEVSKKYHVDKATIRFWEKEAVMPPVPRDQNGYRNFTKFNEEWIHFIIALRKAGISIPSLKQYTSLIIEGDSSIPKRKAILQAQEDKINQEINDLIQTRDYLHNKIKRYGTHLLQYEKKNLNHLNQKQG
ncbi:MerR family transcriptional regulator [Lactobacillus sp. Sy-1]|uniref:MerR family transcriptional regulator n=1 Tax=Lactobacillus sp. Sy-1 TaxID=2109645 RepID=UPI001C5A8723|nr:MerR family transcriptional regulator [Lactobacillus sp. Sy-1]MBW1606186.1 MerR family transcriptional regulator [Lactobacillus sp. Sy-1]